MSVEPKISGRSAVAVFVGATIFVLVIILALYGSLFTFEHGDDGPIRGFAAIVMISPILWFIMLIYFAGLSLCKAYKFKYGLFVGVFLSTLFSSLFFYNSYVAEYWLNIFVISAILFLLLFVAFGLGTAGWLKCLKPHITK